MRWMIPWCVCCILINPLLRAQENASPQTNLDAASQSETIVKEPVQFDISGPVIQTGRVQPGIEQKRREIPLLTRPPAVAPSGAQSDAAVQQQTGPLIPATPGVSFDGLISQGYYPPDPNIAVGPSYVVEGVNIEFSVYNKSGNFIGAINPWSGFGGPCETAQGGDIIVQYDRAADRWVIAQLGNNGGPTYYYCIAVSTTNNPTGSYYRWAYTFTQFPDYPKLGVWPSGYFTSFNMFQNSGNGSYVQPQVCAYDRNTMLSGGASPTAICRLVSSSYFSLLPSDLDGATQPPANSPNYYLSDLGGHAAVYLWKFAPNFTNPSASSFTGPTTISVPSFSTACLGSCIPQPGTSQKLDALGDRMMYRVAYRNFGSYESLVVNRTVDVNSHTAIRWYEIRNPNGTPTAYQAATYAPDSTTNRWMGSMAMDKNASIALGYSIGNSTTYPSIAYTGRFATDTVNTLESENILIQGSGSQTNTNRWGDYTSMRIDPADDLTFWYVNQYNQATGGPWVTRIGSFKLNPPAITCSAAPSCGGSGNVVTAGITLTCSSATYITTSAQACGLNFGCSAVVNGPSGTLTQSTAFASNGAQGAGSCNFTWSYLGNNYSTTLTAH